MNENRERQDSNYMDGMLLEKDPMSEKFLRKIKFEINLEGEESVIFLYENKSGNNLEGVPSEV